MSRALLPVDRSTGFLAVFLSFCLWQACFLVHTSSALSQQAEVSQEEIQLDVMFVVDNSGSMKKNDPAFITRDVLSRFSKGLTENARFGMVLFDSEARLVSPLKGKGDAGALSAFLKNMDQVDYKGQFTNSPAGIERAIYELKMNGRTSAEKVIVFLTDGIVDTGNPQRDGDKEKWLREDLTAESKEAGIRIFGIAFTERADVQLIQMLALKTEGEYFRAYSASDIPGVFQMINEQIAMRTETPEFSTISPATNMHRDTMASNTSAPREVFDQSADEEGFDSAPVADPAPLWKERVSLTFGALALVVLGAVLFRFIRGKTTQREGPTPPQPLSKNAAPQSLPIPEAELIDLTQIVSGESAPLALNKGRVTIGRDPSNDIVIAKETISSFHATIEFVDGYFFVEDHRSTNGTYLNKRKIDQDKPVKLKSGDRISFAVYEFRFLMVDQAPIGETVMLSSSSFSMDSFQLGKSPMNEPIDEAGLFEKCLIKHLQRVAQLGSPYEAFVRDYFDEEMMKRLSRHADEAMKRTQKELDETGRHILQAPVFYQIWSLPVEIGQAQRWFTRRHGGYLKFLTRLLNSDTFKENQCTVLCLITYGHAKEAWVSMTIVPMGGDLEQVEIISVEFLSEEEKESLSVNFGELGKII